MTTLFLATVLGWFLVILSLFVLFKHEEFKLVMSDIIGQRGLFFVFAMITLILGLLLVVSHNIWVMGWPVVITILSWLVFISGLIRLLCAETAGKMMRSMISHNTNIMIVGVVFLLIGLFLLFKVYAPYF